MQLLIGFGLCLDSYKYNSIASNKLNMSFWFNSTSSKNTYCVWEYNIMYVDQRCINDMILVPFIRCFIHCAITTCFIRCDLLNASSIGLLLNGMIRLAGDDKMNKALVLDCLSFTR
eukprot:249769_1